VNEIRGFGPLIQAGSLCSTEVGRDAIFGIEGREDKSWSLYGSLRFEL
jgi:hypothetical protein